MKKLFFLLFTLVLLSSCDKEETTIPTQQNFVKETFTVDMPENVLKIERIENEHPLILNSNFIEKNINRLKTNESIESAIYYFNNNYKSVLVNRGDFVYANILNDNGEEIENIVADFSLLNSEQKVTVKYLISGKTETIDLNTKGWGTCMKGAINELYNDWDNDAVGTFTCWVTGQLCAIGGGIACAILQI